MADVHVHTLNNSGQESAVLLDDKQDAEMIAYLKGLVARGEMAKVEVRRPPKAAAEKPEPKANADK